MQHKHIALSEKAVEIINLHALDAFPFECCGFLYGDEVDGRFISLAVPALNSKEGDQRRRFEISPLDYMRAEQYAVENNSTLLGVYHSHPNHPAIASVHDLAVAMPYFSYVIASVTEWQVLDLKSWRLKDDERIFEEEEVLVLEEAI